MFKKVFPKKENTRQAPAGTAGKQTNAIQFSNDDLLTIKGKQHFAMYFPNDIFLMIKGKQHFPFYFLKKASTQ